MFRIYYVIDDKYMYCKDFQAIDKRVAKEMFLNYINERYNKSIKVEIKKMEKRVFNSETQMTEVIEVF